MQYALNKADRHEPHETLTIHHSPGTTHIRESPPIFLSSLMIRWIPYTFVRTVLFFIGGILLGYYSPDVIPVWMAVSSMGLLVLLYFIVVLSDRRYRRLFNPGWITLPLMFFMGYCHVTWKTESRYEDHIVNNKEKVSYYDAIVTRFPEEKARSWKNESKVTEVRTEEW